jgi:hypothetical protein
MSFISAVLCEIFSKEKQKKHEECRESMYSAKKYVSNKIALLTERSDESNRCVLTQEIWNY